MNRNYSCWSLFLVGLFVVFGISPVYAAPAAVVVPDEIGLSGPSTADDTKLAETGSQATVAGTDAHAATLGTAGQRAAKEAFRLPVADPVPGAAESHFVATPKKKSLPSTESRQGCGTQEEQLAVCCAAAGISGLLGADACRRGDMTTALLAGGVFSVLASGVIGGVVGWQYAEAVGMEDTALATQIGAGVGVAGSLLTVGGAMLVLGSGSACMQNCLGCGNAEQSKRPAKKRRRRTRRPRRGRSL